MHLGASTFIGSFLVPSDLYSFHFPLVHSGTFSHTCTHSLSHLKFLFFLKPSNLFATLLPASLTSCMKSHQGQTRHISIVNFKPITLLNSDQEPVLILFWPELHVFFKDSISILPHLVHKSQCFERKDILILFFFFENPCVLSLLRSGHLV